MTGTQPPRPPRGGRPSAPDDASLALAGLDPAAWTRANAAQVLPLDYARRGVNGAWRGVYTPVPIAHPPHWCDHLDSVCRSCLPAWAEDHALALFRHGPAGARAGCACPVCRTSRPRSDDTPTGDATLVGCLPDVGGHHRHLTLTAVPAVPARPAEPQHGRCGPRLIVVTIPGPDACPGTGLPGSDAAGDHHNGSGQGRGRRHGAGVAASVQSRVEGRHDCRHDDAAAVPPELLTAAAAVLEELADALAAAEEAHG